MGVITGYADDTSTSDDDKFLTVDSGGSTKLTPASNLNKYMGPGWILSGDSWSFSSWNSSTKTGVINTNAGATTKYSYGMWISFSQATLGVKYAKVVAVTTSTVTALFHNGTQLDNEAITGPVYSTAASPFGVNSDPVSVVPSFTGFTIGNGTVTYARLSLNGKDVRYEGKITLGSTSSMTAALRIGLPISSASYYVIGDALGTGYMLDSGVAEYEAFARWASTTTFALVTLATNTGSNPVFINASITTYSAGLGTPFTWSTGDTFQWNISYRAA